MIDSQEWRAVRTVDAGGQPRIRVTGVCIVPTSGWGAELRRHEPQEAADELVLDLLLDRPTGPVLQVISSVPVAYEESTNRPYERISILPDGPRLHVGEGAPSA